MQFTSSRGLGSSASMKDMCHDYYAMENLSSNREEKYDYLEEDCQDYEKRMSILKTCLHPRKSRFIGQNIAEKTLKKYKMQLVRDALSKASIEEEIRNIKTPKMGIKGRQLSEYDTTSLDYFTSKRLSTIAIASLSPLSKQKMTPLNKEKPESRRFASILLQSVRTPASNGSVIFPAVQTMHKNRPSMPKINSHALPRMLSIDLFNIKPIIKESSKTRNRATVHSIKNYSSKKQWDLTSPKNNMTKDDSRLQIYADIGSKILSTKRKQHNRQMTLSPVDGTYIAQPIEAAINGYYDSNKTLAMNKNKQFLFPQTTKTKLPISPV